MKRFIAIILVLALTLACVGCGNKVEPKPTVQDPNGGGNPIETQKPTAPVYKGPNGKTYAYKGVEIVCDDPSVQDQLPEVKAQIAELFDEVFAPCIISFDDKKMTFDYEGEKFSYDYAYKDGAVDITDFDMGSDGEGFDYSTMKFIAKEGEFIMSHADKYYMDVEMTANIVWEEKK